MGLVQDGEEGEDHRELSRSASRFAAHLSEAAAQPPKGGVHSASQQVWARMAEDAARWLLRWRRGAGEDVLERERCILQLSPLLPEPRRDHLQLAAVALAEAFAG